MRRGPVSRAVRALLMLPHEIIETILRLISTRITMSSYYTYDSPLFYQPWAGTRRNVASNSIIARYLSSDMRNNRAQDFGDGMITNTRGQIFFEKEGQLLPALVADII